jgi:hypothetical protein
MAKSIRIKENQRRAETAEALMIQIGKAINANLVHLGRDIGKANEALKLIYEEMMARTLRGRWKRFKKWIGGSK